MPIGALPHQHCHLLQCTLPMCPSGACPAIIHYSGDLFRHMHRWIHAHAGLTLVNMVWFWYVAMGYRYKDVKHAQKRYVGGTSLKPPRGPVPPWARAREVGIPIGHRRPVSCPLHVMGLL